MTFHGTRSSVSYSSGIIDGAQGQSSGGERAPPAVERQMYYRGSYRHLLKHSKSALLAAIEIYNKPRFEYRDECFVILLLNAWELALKALLSKNKQSIYYPKKRKQPYRTFSWTDAFEKSKAYLPKTLDVLAVGYNLELLANYRDNAVHFYNVLDFGVLIYALAQTSVVNLKDFFQKAFDDDIAAEVNWKLLPLGIEPPVDPIEYISRSDGGNAKAAVRQFISELAAATKEVSNAGQDTGRLLTVFEIKLESTKKIKRADAVVGVTGPEAGVGPLAIIRRVDPNISHPLRQKDILKEVETLHGQRFTSHTFQAIAWKYDLKRQPQYCWQATGGLLTRYSQDVVALIKKLTKADLEATLTDYRSHQRKAAKIVA